MPLGKETMLHPRYLSSEQALADYAQLLRWYQSSADPVLPVVSFGGSYGGMLSAWMRMKYPNIVTGALSASAPILQFQDLAGYNPNAYNDIIYQDYANQSSLCASTLQSSIGTIQQLGSSGSAGLQTITDNMGLCQNLTQQKVPVLINFVEQAISYMAMTNYPGDSDFLQPMPSYPVTVACDQISGLLGGVASPSNAQLLQALRSALNVYYNWTGTQPCFDISQSASGNLGLSSWDIQACTEMIFPINSGGIFPPSTFDLNATIKECRHANLISRPYWVSLNYQSDQIAMLNSGQSHQVPTLGFSNVIFSNGQFDPWRSGGVVNSLSPSVIAIVISQAAHHLDLRFPTSQDPQSVIAARNLEATTIQSWIDQFWSTSRN